MQVMKILPQQNLNTIPKAALDAENNGFDMIASMENRYDPFLPLGISVVSTKKIKLGTAVAICFPRSPMVMANTCWDLQKASKGRFVLGIGPQIKPHNEKRFSVPWTAPVPRMREYIQALRAIWRNWELGEKLEFRGDHYNFTLMTPNFVPESNGELQVPITIAAVGPKMLQLAGEICDGVHLHPFCTRSYMEDIALPLICRGLQFSSISRESFQIAGGGFLVTGATDSDVAKAMEWTRYRIAFYGSTPSYWPVLEHHGLGELGRKLNVMTKQGLWDKLAEQISDDTLQLFAAIGRHDQLTGAIKSHFGDSTDMIYSNLSADNKGMLPAELLQDIQKLAVPFRKFNRAW